MASGAYIGVGGIARKISKMYIGAEGKACEIKKGYIGVNGKARLFYELFGFPVLTAAGADYILDSTKSVSSIFDYVVSGDHWELAIYASGSILLPGMIIDAFIVGGGGGGGTGGGQGGTGGCVTTLSGLALNGSYNIVIGAGGAKDSSGGTTSFGTYSACGGGAGAVVSGDNTNGTGLGGAHASTTISGGIPAHNGGDGLLAFSAASSLLHSGKKFGAGGGGGEWSDYYPSIQFARTGAPGLGGTDGGGNGETRINNTKNRHAAFYGAGGAGGFIYTHLNQKGDGGNGFAGIVILRDAR